MKDEFSVEVSRRRDRDYVYTALTFLICENLRPLRIDESVFLCHL